MKTLSTLHTRKGREAARVLIATDFSVWCQTHQCPIRCFRFDTLESYCSECHPEVSGIRLFRSDLSDVIRVSQGMFPGIQKYIANGVHVVHLRPHLRSSGASRSGASRSGNTCVCGRSVSRATYCSILCALQTRRKQLSPTPSPAL